ncbi:potassium transporter KtrB [bacterium]|nr:potassium transporter KtrB [bacterium]
MKRLWSRLAVRAAAFLDRCSSVQLLILGYASYMLLGWLALCLPICQSDPQPQAIDHLFTAVSAVSTTGLVTVSTSDSYSFWGELVVLSLIQLGGLGYMTLSSFTVLAVSGQLSPLRNRMVTSTLALPEGFQPLRFLKMVCCFTFAIEFIGALCLYPRFAAHQVSQPLWCSLFHSVSAFCTAGFGLFNNSLEDYSDDVALNLVIAVLSYIGAIGFIVLHDLWESLTRREVTATLTTRIILWSTLILSLGGTVLYALDEPQGYELPWTSRWMSAGFQVMSASTTVGFNTVPISGLSDATLVLLMLLMVIGASPSGTGGGLKTTTMTALGSEMLAVLRGRQTATFFRRAIPVQRLRAATANAAFYGLTLCVGIYSLTLVDASPPADQAFECISALGTVGLSRGMTGQLSVCGKLVIIGLMFLGRVGPLVVGTALLARSTPQETGLPVEDVVI